MRILTLVLLFITAVAGADNNTFRNIDVFELEVATDTQISPDGKQIAFVMFVKADYTAFPQRSLPTASAEFHT